MSPALNIFLAMSLSSSFTTPASAAIIIGVYPAYNYSKCYHSTYHYNSADKSEISELKGKALKIDYSFLLVYPRFKDRGEEEEVKSAEWISYGFHHLKVTKRRNSDPLTLASHSQCLVVALQLFTSRLCLL